MPTLDLIHVALAGLVAFMAWRTSQIAAAPATSSANPSGSSSSPATPAAGPSIVIPVTVSPASSAPAVSPVTVPPAPASSTSSAASAIAPGGWLGHVLQMAGNLHTLLMSPIVGQFAQSTLQALSGSAITVRTPSPAPAVVPPAAPASAPVPAATH